MPPLLLLKEAWGHRALLLTIAVVGLLALTKRQQENIGALKAQLAAKPLVEASKHVAKASTRARGPVKTTKTVVTAPDGTKTATTVKEAAAETIASTSTSDEVRKETPAPAVATAPRRTRYVGLALDPFAQGRPRRARAGLTLWDRIDAGASWEPRRAPSDGALQIELTYRF